LDKYDSLPLIGDSKYSSEGMIGVGSQLIRSNFGSQYYRCEWDTITRSIATHVIEFINEEMIVQNRLIVGKPCFNHNNNSMSVWNKNMHYLNSDSIYYAYTTNRYDNRVSGNNPSDISIANFNKNGQLNFNYTLNIVEDTMSWKDIFQCKATSNGGVLVCGTSDGWSFGGEDAGFLLLYHPTIENVRVKEPVSIAKREISPNPTHSHFTVSNAENTDIELFNILGQKVLQTRSTEENAVIYVDFLPQGLYVLKVRGVEFSSTHKIQVVK
jgi:hypothetical protein